MRAILFRSVPVVIAGCVAVDISPAIVGDSTGSSTGIQAATGDAAGSGAGGANDLPGSGGPGGSVVHGAGGEDAGDGGDPACVPCSQALMGNAFFTGDDHGRTYQNPCPGSLALWQIYYDTMCSTGMPCHDPCGDSLCMSGFPSGNCLVCVTHVTGWSYSDCESDK